MREGGESGVLLYEQKKVTHYYNGYGLTEHEVHRHIFRNGESKLHVFRSAALR